VAYADHCPRYSSPGDSLAIRVADNGAGHHPTKEASSQSHGAHNLAPVQGRNMREASAGCAALRFAFLLDLQHASALKAAPGRRKAVTLNTYRDRAPHKHSAVAPRRGSLRVHQWLLLAHAESPRHQHNKQETLAQRPRGTAQPFHTRQGNTSQLRTGSRTGITSIGRNFARVERAAMVWVLSSGATRARSRSGFRASKICC
jgi:hypothetical protein